MADRLDISQRKKDHLALCAGDKVGFREKTALFEQVELVHCALPEMHADAVDSRVELFGKTLAAPVVISAMTGGTDEAAKINKDLAQVAEELGLAIGLGSQRAMFERPATAWTFEVRDRAPNVLLFGNLGLVQARKMTTAEIRTLCEQVGADALCIHLNPAMEIVQPGGDRDFAGGLEVFRRLQDQLGIPVIAKETGCGLSRSVGQRLRKAGVRHVDVSGAGGTSWVAVETRRADAPGQALGEVLWDWGIPTAASVAQVAEVGFETVFATGGIKTGLDIARAIALGATVGGIARPVLQALDQGGIAGARAHLEAVEAQFRATLLLTGSRSVADLRRCPRIVVGELRDWIA